MGEEKRMENTSVIEKGNKIKIPDEVLNYLDVANTEIDKLELEIIKERKIFIKKSM